MNVNNIFRLIKLPDLVTLINALLGFTAVLMVVQDPANVYHASILIVLAVMADGIDGAIARRLEYSVLGEQLDSLADVISFGVAPAVIAFAILSPRYHYLYCIVGGAFLACGILRLARFNVMDSGKGFSGLPITSSGLTVAIYILVLSGNNRELTAYGLMGMMLILAVLMVSRVPYPKIRDVRLTGLVVVLLIIMVALFYLDQLEALKYAALLNLIFIGVYIVSPIIYYGTRRFQ